MSVFTYNFFHNHLSDLPSFVVRNQTHYAKGKDHHVEKVKEDNLYQQGDIVLGNVQRKIQNHRIRHRHHEGIEDDGRNHYHHHTGVLRNRRLVHLDYGNVHGAWGEEEDSWRDSIDNVSLTGMKWT